MSARPARQVSVSKVISAPVTGLNAFDPIVAMQETDALKLVNFFPRPYGLSLRKGFMEHQTLATSLPIESLISVVSALDSPGVSGSEETLFAAAGGAIYNVTVAGALPTVAVSGLGASENANRFQAASLSNGLDSYTYCVNGVSDPIVIRYPATVTRLVAGDGVVAWTINGVDPRTFIHVTTFKRSLWFTEKDSSRAWYLPPGSLWGVATAFDFGPYMQRGGFVVALAVWSMDDSVTSEARLVALTSGGEALVFSGSDPSLITAWANIGIYYISPPIGRRCFARMDGDLLVLTHRGIVSMYDTSNKLVSGGGYTAGNGAKVEQFLSSQAALYGGLFGWQMLVFPQENQLQVNLPQEVEAEYLQLTLNTTTKAWSMFHGQPAFCSTLFKDRPVFGLRNTVYEGWVGGKDRVGANGTGGENIEAECLQAYTYLDSPTQVKVMKLYRPVFIVEDVGFTYKAGFNVDFSFEGVFGLAHESTTPGPLWNSALWDTATWSQGSPSTKQKWETGTGVGHAFSFKVKISSGVEVLWVANEYVYESGGLL